MVEVEGLRKEGVYVYQELYFAVHQKIIQHCKAIILQFNKIKESTDSCLCGRGFFSKKHAGHEHYKKHL